MASVVEVETTKPNVKTLTLKMTASDARDLKIFIQDWYRTNYSYGHEEKAKANPVHKAIVSGLDGTSGAPSTVVAAF
jgi:hypothetical protein